MKFKSRTTRIKMPVWHCNGGEYIAQSICDVF